MMNERLNPTYRVKWKGGVMNCIFKSERTNKNFIFLSRQTLLSSTVLGAGVITLSLMAVPDKAIADTTKTVSTPQTTTVGPDNATDLDGIYTLNINALVDVLPPQDWVGQPPINGVEIFDKAIDTDGAKLSRAVINVNSVTKAPSVGVAVRAEKAGSEIILNSSSGASISGNASQGTGARLYSNGGAITVTLNAGVSGVKDGLDLDTSQGFDIGALNVTTGSDAPIVGTKSVGIRNNIMGGQLPNQTFTVGDKTFNLGSSVTGGITGILITSQRTGKTTINTSLGAKITGGNGNIAETNGIYVLAQDGDTILDLGDEVQALGQGDTANTASIGVKVTSLTQNNILQYIAGAGNVKITTNSAASISGNDVGISTLYMGEITLSPGTSPYSSGYKDFDLGSGPVKGIHNQSII